MERERECVYIYIYIYERECVCVCVFPGALEHAGKLAFARLSREPCTTPKSVGSRGSTPEARKQRLNILGCRSL